MTMVAEEVHAVAVRHATRIRRPFNRCLDASLRLVAELDRRGVPARVLRCSDGILQAPDADRRWRSLRHAPRCWVHYVVEAGDVVVDLTRRQFFPAGAHPHFATHADLAREWLTIEPAQHVLEGASSR